MCIEGRHTGEGKGSPVTCEQHGNSLEKSTLASHLIVRVNISEE